MKMLRRPFARDWRFVRQWPFLHTPQAEVPVEWSPSLRGKLQQARLFSDLALDQQPRKIGICACHTGAGSTSVAVNLALMLMERTGQAVALVEANLRNPTLARRLGVAAEPGFAAFADGSAKLDEAIRILPNGLAVIPGTVEAQAMPLQRQAAARLGQLAERFPHLVFDLPSALDYPDIGLLAPALDGVILVIEAEATRWQVAREAKQRLESAGVQLLGAVLNKRPFYIPAWLYRLL